MKAHTTSPRHCRGIAAMLATALLAFGSGTVAAATEADVVA